MMKYPYQGNVITVSDYIEAMTEALDKLMPGFPGLTSGLPTDAELDGIDDFCEVSARGVASFSLKAVVTLNGRKTYRIMFFTSLPPEQILGPGVYEGSETDDAWLRDMIMLDAESAHRDVIRQLGYSEGAPIVADPVGDDPDAEYLQWFFDGISSGLLKPGDRKSAELIADRRGVSLTELLGCLDPKEVFGDERKEDQLE